MKIQNLAGIIGGKLLNEPQIGQISGFCFELSKIKSGECFFAANELEAKLAASGGAYAIVGDIKPFDDEIAFICVADLKAALLRLVRYFVSIKELKVACVGEIGFLLLGFVSGDFLLGKNEPELLLKQVIGAKTAQVLFISDESLAKSASFNASFLAGIPNESKQNSLFYSDFIFENKKYSLALSPIFLPKLLGILEFLKEQNAYFSLRELPYFSAFRALFVGRDNAPVISSQRAMICVNNKAIWDFVKNELKLPSKEANNELKNASFARYLLVFGEYDEIKELLAGSKNESELF